MTARQRTAAPWGPADFGPAAPVAVRRRPGIGALRLAGVAAASVAAAWVHRNHDPGPLCPLRRLTGVPCPLCGSTTVFMEAGAGHGGAALLANPVMVVATLAFLAAPVLGVDPLAAIARLSRRTLWIGGTVLIVASWLWQLHRFGFLS